MVKGLEGLRKRMDSVHVIELSGDACLWCCTDYNHGNEVEVSVDPRWSRGTLRLVRSVILYIVQYQNKFSQVPW